MHFFKLTAISVLVFALTAVAVPVDNVSNAVAAAASPQQADVPMVPAVSAANKQAFGSLTDIAEGLQLPQHTAERLQFLKPVFVAMKNIKDIVDMKTRDVVDVRKELEVTSYELKKIRVIAQNIPDFNELNLYKLSRIISLVDHLIHINHSLLDPIKKGQN
ncbi:hypothetical protein H4219_004724 [Mycoemilia scoparia]|uniref:Uncharacterized protein n=1 Tax=Mycoemilia scoparia TaxID=417184 RepID=A0A9W7ZXB7_9FUNG|nr:hypothetical protein H4219_004724 [Mycoemilia scoparia]